MTQFMLLALSPIFILYILSFLEINIFGIIGAFITALLVQQSTYLEDLSFVSSHPFYCYKCIGHG